MSSKHAVPDVLDGVNLLRGVAAIAVAIFHATPLTGGQWVPGGYLAVDFFFLLSGFVLSHAYDSRLAGGMTARGFVVVRLIRFLPLYLAGLAIGLALEGVLILVDSPNAIEPGKLIVVAALGIVFLPYLVVGKDMFPLNVPSWSLHHEFVVNTAWAIFHKQLKGALLMSVAVASLVVVVVGVLDFGSAAFGSEAQHYVYALGRALFSFIVGVLIFREGIRPIVGMRVSALVFSAALLVPVPKDVRWAFDLVCVVVVFPMLLPGIAQARFTGRRIRSASRWLGDMSYGLYAIHYPLIWLTSGLVGRAGLESVRMFVGVALVASLVFVCGHIERKLDSPLRRRARKFTDRWFTSGARA